MSFENAPHNLAEFVSRSMDQPIQLEGLPENVNASMAAKLFGRMSSVRLQQLPSCERYFSGWFNDTGRAVQTEDGKLIFTIFSVDLAKLGAHRLRIEPEGQKLLQEALSSS